MEIETIIGSDIDLVSIAEDFPTLLDVDANPWLNRTWEEVARYLPPEELLPPLEIKTK